MSLPINIPSIGADPEFFIEDMQGNIVPSTVLFKDKRGAGRYIDTPYSKWIPDGVQIELNLKHPFSCREVMGGHIAVSFDQLVPVLDKLGYKLSWKQSVEITPDVLLQMPPEDRKFGCNQSFNIYDSSATIKVDGETYMFRACGGHIHLGLQTGFPSIWNNNTWIGRPVVDRRHDLVPLLDIFVGIPSVIVDRDPGQVERRRNYGRAGEFRLPTYGLEYRTLSSFWLKDYILLSMVMGLTRHAVNVLEASLNPSLGFTGVVDKLYTLINPNEVRSIIDANDADGATEILSKVTSFVFANNLTFNYEGYSVLNSKASIKNFEDMLQFIRKEGLDTVFPESNRLSRWYFGFAKDTRSSKALYTPTTFNSRGLGIESFVAKRAWTGKNEHFQKYMRGKQEGYEHYTFNNHP